MSALGLNTLLPHLGEISPAVAARWIAASLAQAAALHEHDGWLYPVDPARRVTSERLHAAWLQWADDADALLRRAESLVSAGHALDRTGELRDAVGSIQAMLQLAPDKIEQRRLQAQRGEVYSIEEVRRELRVGNRR